MVELQRGWGQAIRALNGTFAPMIRAHAWPVAPAGDSSASTERLTRSPGSTLAIPPKKRHNLYWSEQETEAQGVKVVQSQGLQL